MRTTTALALVIAGTALACGSSALKAAERGDQTALRAEIADKHSKGKLSNGEAACIARAVAEREIASAKEEAQALARIKETRSCAPELDDALAERMKTHDGAGAEAALARLEDKKLGESAARDWLGDADDRWRAVGTRALTREKDREARQKAIVDPSGRVRRSAIRASAEAKDPADLDVLLETARVDPELLLRNEAIRATSAVLRAEGARAADIAVRLRDLWTTGDDAVREDIAVAWALTPVFENGGREALRVTVASGRGPGAVAAAGVVLRTRAKDAELTASASALVARTIAEGSRRDRQHALAVARTEGAELEALRAAAKDDDRDVMVGALARLLESKPDRDAAIKKLEEIAGHGPRTDAVRARSILAGVGHLRVQAWIEKDLASENPSFKTQAASALASLGRSARAAPLLADPDPSVRTRAACTMLVASRR
jgi:hypothetical protein